MSDSSDNNKFVLIFLLFCGGSFYGMLFAQDSWVFGIGAWVIFALIFALILFVVFKQKKSWKSRTNEALIGLGLASVASLGIAGYVALIVSLATYILSLPTGPKAAFFGATAVFCIAAMLFYLRLNFRAVYGLSEVFVGLSIAVYRFNTEFSKSSELSFEFYAAVLTAAIYLVVRGFDNLHQGITKEPIDPLYQRVLNWARREKT